MINILTLIIKYRRFILPLVAVLALGLSYTAGRFTGYQAGQKQAEIACANNKVKEIEKAVLEAKKSSQNLERNMQNAKNKKDADTDDSLRRLGIMRDIGDR